MNLKLLFTSLVFILIIPLISHGQGTWTEKAKYPGGQNLGGTTFVIGNKIYVKTGQEFDEGTRQYYRSFWEYDTDKNTWTKLADFPGALRMDLFSFAVKGKGYVVSGRSLFTNDRLNDVWQYDPTFNTWKQMGNFPGPALMRGVSFAVNDKGYIGLGAQTDNAFGASANLWEYEPTNDKWTKRSEIPSGIMIDGASFVIGGKAYLGTGGSYNEFYSGHFFEYDPSVDKWTRKANFAGSSRLAAVGFSDGKKGYITTGVDGGLAYPTDTWVYNPELDVWAKVVDFAGKSVFYGNSASLNGKGYILFGSNDQGRTSVNEIWQYTPDNMKEQKIYFDATKTVTTNPIEFDPGATTSSGLPVKYTSSNPLVAKVVNNRVQIVDNGVVTITATQEGDNTYRPATSVAQFLTIVKADQVVTFPPIAAKKYGDADFNLTATSGSGRSLNFFTDNSAVATVDNTGKIHITGAGTTIITVSNPGDHLYKDVAVTRTLTVAKADQNLSFASLPIKKLTDADFAAAASATSGLPVSFSSSNTGVATIVNGQVRLLAGGTTVITASQAGNANYNAAANINQTLTVQYALPANNFKLSVLSATCKGEANGSININATQNLNYTATLTGTGIKTANFTNTTTFSNLPAGTYNVCITVSGQAAYKQCFDLVITEPKDLALYANVDKRTNTVTLQLSGADTYAVTLNGKTYNITQSTLTLPLSNNSNKLSVNSALPCQGKIEQIINLSGDHRPYPNPFTDILYINLGETIVKKALVDVYQAIDGRKVESLSFSGRSGVIQVDVSKLNYGVYSLHLQLDGNVQTFKIQKK